MSNERISRNKGTILRALSSGTARFIRTFTAMHTSLGVGSCVGHGRPRFFCTFKSGQRGAARLISEPTGFNRADLYLKTGWAGIFRWPLPQLY
jgi:hypothetical protein